jgi:uncharacterized coiled-coil protein SlyX
MRLSTRIAVLVVSGLSLASAPAFADKDKPPSAEVKGHHDRAKELIRLTIKVLESRVAELERTMAFDNHESKELNEHAKIRDASADRMAARAKEYREIIAKLPQGDPMRAQLDTIASALESGASHDHDFANQRRAAAKILADQAAQSAEFIRLDKISIEQYKGML